jgi:hypothetical protein
MHETMGRDRATSQNNYHRQLEKCTSTDLLQASSSVHMAYYEYVLKPLLAFIRPVMLAVNTWWLKLCDRWHGLTLSSSANDDGHHDTMEILKNW